MVIGCLTVVLPANWNIRIVGFVSEAQVIKLCLQMRCIGLESVSSTVYKCSCVKGKRCIASACASTTPPPPLSLSLSVCLSLSLCPSPIFLSVSLPLYVSVSLLVCLIRQKPYLDSFKPNKKTFVFRSALSSPASGRCLLSV